MTLVYQVRIFRGMGIKDLEKQINEFLLKVPVVEGNNKMPSTRLADSGNVAMVVYQTNV